MTYRRGWMTVRKACALEGCDQVVPRRGARYCSHRHRQRAHEQRVRLRRLVDHMAMQIRQAAGSVATLQAIAYGRQDPPGRVGPAS